MTELKRSIEVVFTEEEIQLMNTVFSLLSAKLKWNYNNNGFFITDPIIFFDCHESYDNFKVIVEKLRNTELSIDDLPF